MKGADSEHNEALEKLKGLLGEDPHNGLLRED